jgi:hypothetical protein
MNQLNPPDRFTLIKDPMFVEINDEIVLISSIDDQNYVLNAVGTKLWKCLQTQSMSQEDMVAYLTKRYDVNTEQAMTDVAVFIQAMTHHQLLT